MPSRARVEQLIALVENGKYVEALQEFYADDATMQENNQPPRSGLELLVKHEQGVMAAFKEIRTLPVQSFLVDGDHVVINWVFEFVGNDGRKFRMDELAHQVWRADKIIRERFYYDPARQEV
jgi:ketosteroid isomerase-like protein